MADAVFSSLNPYQSIAVLEADSPDLLIEEIQKIRTPIKIMAFTTDGKKHYAYIQGDHRIKKRVKRGSAD